VLSYDKLGLLQGLPTEACTPLLTADIPNAQWGGGMLHADTFATHQWHCLPGLYRLKP
jgi:hypothetical protein